MYLLELAFPQPYELCSLLLSKETESVTFLALSRDNARNSDWRLGIFLGSRSQPWWYLKTFYLPWVNSVVWTPNLSIWRPVLYTDPIRFSSSLEARIVSADPQSQFWLSLGGQLLMDTTVSQGGAWPCCWCQPTSWQSVPSWLKCEFKHLNMQLDVKCVIGCDPEQLHIHISPLKWDK